MPCDVQWRGAVGCVQEADPAGASLQVFEAAPQEVRGVQAKRAAPDYFCESPGREQGPEPAALHDCAVSSTAHDRIAGAPAHVVALAPPNCSSSVIWPGELAAPRAAGAAGWERGGGVVWGGGPGGQW